MFSLTVQQLFLYYSIHCCIKINFQHWKEGNAEDPLQLTKIIFFLQQIWSQCGVLCFSLLKEHIFTIAMVKLMSLVSFVDQV